MGKNAPKIAKNPEKTGFFVAQRRGFEPPDTFLHHTISKGEKRQKWSKTAQKHAKNRRFGGFFLVKSGVKSG